MRRKGSVLAASAAAAAMLFAACGGSDGGSGGGGATSSGGGDSGKKSYNVAIVRWDAGDIFFNGVQAGEEKAIKELEQKNGVKITTKVVAANDASGQLNGLRSLMAQGIDGVSLVPWRGESMVNTLKQLHNEKIPVVVHNLTVPGAEYPFVAFDNQEAGKLAGTAMVDILKKARGDDWASKGGTIMLLRGDVTASFDKDRFAGYMSVLKPLADKNPKLKIVERANLDYEGEKARKAVDDQITRVGKDNMLAIGSVDGTMAVGGALPALKTSGAVVKEGAANRVPVTSIDCSKAELDAIQAGSLAHCSEQPALAEGELVQSLLFDMMKNKTLTPSAEAQNVAGWENAPWAPLQETKRPDVAGSWFKTKTFAVPGQVPVDSEFHWANAGVSGG
jgi:ABC-type sugar transport system substrate-binding protein